MDEDLSGGENETESTHQLISVDQSAENAQTEVMYCFWHIVRMVSVNVLENLCDMFSLQVEPEMFVLDTDEDPAPLDCLMDQLDLHPDDGDDIEDAGAAQAVGMFFSYELS